MCGGFMQQTHSLRYCVWLEGGCKGLRCLVLDYVPIGVKTDIMYKTNEPVCLPHRNNDSGPADPVDHRHNFDFGRLEHGERNESLPSSLGSQSMTDWRDERPFHGLRAGYLSLTDTGTDPEHGMISRRAWIWGREGKEIT